MPPGQVSLTIYKSVDSPTHRVGDTVQYMITVVNTGSTTATSVTVFDYFPGEINYTGNTVSQGSFSYVPYTGTWTVGNLASGASATLQITGTLISGTVGNTISNNVQVQPGGESDPDWSDNNASIPFTVIS
jgi:uncharacterized repeat protein (TIGR01451 family)